MVPVDNYKNQQQVFIISNAEHSEETRKQTQSNNGEGSLAKYFTLQRTILSNKDDIQLYIYFLVVYIFENYLILNSHKSNYTCTISCDKAELIERAGYETQPVSLLHVFVLHLLTLHKAQKLLKCMQINK